MNIKTLIETVIKRNRDQADIEVDITFHNKTTGKNVALAYTLIRDMELKYGNKTLSMLNGLISDELLDLNSK